MPPSRIVQIVLALSLASAFKVAAANEYTTRDIRQPIIVTAKERNQYLFEMRDHLHSLFNIHLALSRNDFKAAAVAARPMGTLLENTPASLRERLPEEYIQLSIALREAVQAMARNAEEKKDMAAFQNHLAETMTYCSGCHDTYRFEVRPVVPASK